MMLKIGIVWIGIAMVAASGNLQAQDAGPENVATDLSPSALYHQEADRLNREHWKILMEIDAANRAAHKAFSEENARRSVALGQANRDAHTDLAASDLSVSERGEQATQIQAENAERRKAHAAWRDATYQEILGSHEAKRKAQFDAYHASLDALRAELQRKMDLVGVTSGELVAPVLLPGDESATVPEEPGMLPVRPGDPQPSLEEPDVDGLPSGPVEAHVNPETTAQINTQVAPERFDIALYEIEAIKSDNVQLRGGDLFSDPLYVILTIANRGSHTYAFEGNQFEVVIEEGVHNRSGRTLEIDDYELSARATYEVTVPADHGLQVWLPVRRRDNRSGMRRFRDTARSVLSAGILGSEIYTGSRPAKVKPNIWYTVDVRLFTPEEVDDDNDRHGAYLHVRFNDQLSVVEQDGPFYFSPPPDLSDVGKF